MPKAVVRPHPAGGRAPPGALLPPDEALSGTLLPPDEALSGALLPPDKMPFGTLTPPDEGLSGFGGAGGVDAADGLCGRLCGWPSRAPLRAAAARALHWRAAVSR